LRFGDYELIEKIGIGGMAEVYKARTQSAEGVERTLVIKKILPQFATNHHFVRMLVAEARVSSLLSHPNIVQIFELGEIDAQYYIAMEYVPGPDLLTILTSATRANLRVPLGIALFLISDICNGLHYAHQAKDSRGRPLKLIHRDISPSNILISDKGSVKLMDFGVASADLTRSGRQRAVEPNAGALKGKLGYMAPEQVSGMAVDHRADIFALGIVLFETLTLKRLFLGKTDPETLQNVRDARLDLKLQRHPYIPEGVQEILRRALAKDPDQRYQDAGAFREGLMNYLFEERLRVTQRTLARFVNDLNWESNHRIIGREKARDNKALSTSSPRDNSRAEESRGNKHEALETSTFTLHTIEGNAKPTLSYQRMQSLVERGAIAKDDMVSVAGQAPLPFEAIFARHDFQTLLPAAEVALPCVRQGPCNPLMLTKLFYELVSSHDTWTLHVSEAGRAKHLTLKRGEVVAAGSRDGEERLGQLMLSRGLVGADELAAAIISSAERGLLLGDSLIADGKMAPHILLELLQTQLKERVVDILGWEKGWFMLYEGQASKNKAPLDGIDGLELLMQASRLHWGSDDLEQLFRNHMSRPIVMLSSAHEAKAPLPLTPHESRMAARFLTGVSVEDLIASLEPEDTLTTLRLLMLKLATGDIEIGQESQRGGRPS